MILPNLVQSLFPVHDLTHLGHERPQRPGALAAIMRTVDDIALGLDAIDFFWALGRGPLMRGLLRTLTGHGGRPDFGLHVLQLCWNGTTELTQLRTYGVECHYIAASHQHYWLAVGSHQARWAVEILTRTASGRAPRPWSSHVKALHP